jgi:hypothetical protein
MTFDFDNKIFINNGKEYQITYLEDIDVSNMTPMKERKHKESDTLNHNRIIYHDESSKTYYKIWERDYVHNKSFTKAMVNNAYDNYLISPLKSLIFDREHICRGYITFEGEHSDKELYELPELYDICKKGILETNWALCDIVSQNIIKYNEKYCLIDYDDIYPLENFVERGKKLFYNINDDLYLIKPSYYNEYLFNTYFMD